MERSVRRWCNGRVVVLVTACLAMNTSMSSLFGYASNHGVAIHIINAIYTLKSSSYSILIQES